MEITYEITVFLPAVCMGSGLCEGSKAGKRLALFRELACGQHGCEWSLAKQRMVWKDTGEGLHHSRGFALTARGILSKGAGRLLKTRLNVDVSKVDSGCCVLVDWRGINEE